MRQNLATAARLFPNLRNARLVRSWAGIEGMTKDDLPVLGASATTPGLVHAFGFSGHGFCLGPASGAVAAELALDGRATTPLDGMEISRFTQDAQEA